MGGALSTSTPWTRGPVTLRGGVHAPSGLSSIPGPSTSVPPVPVPPVPGAPPQSTDNPDVLTSAWSPLGAERAGCGPSAHPLQDRGQNTSESAHSCPVWGTGVTPTSQTWALAPDARSLSREVVELTQTYHHLNRACSAPLPPVLLDVGEAPHVTETRELPASPNITACRGAYNPCGRAPGAAKTKHSDSWAQGAPSSPRGWVVREGLGRGRPGGKALLTWARRRQSLRGVAAGMLPGWG